MKTSISIYTQFEKLSNKNSLFVEKILERYKKVHNLKSNKQIAERMGLTESAFSNQKNRGSLDMGSLIASCDPGVNLHWLFNGEGSSRLDDSVGSVVERFSDYEDSINDLNKSDISRDEILEFLLKQQETVLDFLRKLKNDSDDS